MWHELSHLPGVANSVISDDFGFPLPALAKNPAQLSSDQIFLGLTKAFRPGHLIIAHGKMGQALKRE
jgi:hypothetical protein